MFKIGLALHVLTAVFAIGPLVHAATSAGWGIRQGDAPAITASAQMLRRYAYASALVVILGFALMSAKRGNPPRAVAEFSETWIWLSTVLWAVAVGVVLAVLVPGLERAGAAHQRSESSTALAGRLSAMGGVVATLFAVIIVLMVYQPGG